MKNLLHFSVLYFLFGFVTLNAQKLSVDELLNTTVEFSGEVLNQGEIYGYLFMYTKDKVDNETKKLYYRFLDQNLNIVFDGEFTSRSLGTYVSARLFNNSIVVTKNNGYRGATLDVTLLILPLDHDTKIKEFVYSEGKMIPIENYKRQKFKAFQFVSNLHQVYRVFTNGDRHFLLAYNNHNDGKENKSFHVFNDELKPAFNYEVSNKGKKGYSFLVLQAVTDNYIVFTESHMKTATKMLKREVLLFSQENFKLLSRHTLENEGRLYNHQLKFREFDGQLYQSAFYSKKSKSGYYNLYKALGMYLMVYDSNGKKIHERYNIWKDLNEKLDINKSGKYGLFRSRPYMLDFQPLGNDLVFYLFTHTSEDFSSNGSRQRVPIPLKHALFGYDYEKMPNNNRLYGFFLTDKLQAPKSKNFNKVEKWAAGSQLYLIQRLNQGHNLLFAVFERTDSGGLLVSKYNSEYTFYTVDKEGIHNSVKLDKKTKNTEIWPDRAKSGYILISEKNTDTKKYNIRLERLDI